MMMKNDFSEEQEYDPEMIEERDYEEYGYEE